MVNLAADWHKYTRLFLLSWQSGLVYRTSLVIWRSRQLLSTVMALTVWTVIFNGQTTAFNYTQPEMISYVFLVSILQSVILASSLNDLASQVYSGEISSHLLKPERLFVSFATVELADKARNLLFSLVEGCVLYAVFQPVLVSPSLTTWLVVMLWVGLGTAINFFITILFGTLGFWSPDTWGPKFLFFMVLEFTAGKLYPLDILPPLLQKILLATPFPYLSYMQIQLFLGRLTATQQLWGWFSLVSWLLISGSLANWIWRKGIHSYEATGH